MDASARGRTQVLSAYPTAVFVTFALSGITWGRPDPAHVLLIAIAAWGMLSRNLVVEQVASITGVSRALGLFLAFYLLSLAFTGWAEGQHLLFTANLLANVLMACFLASYVTGSDRLALVERAYVTGALALSAAAVLSSVGVLQAQPFRPTLDGRAMPLTGDPNVFASFLVPAFLFTMDGYAQATAGHERARFATATLIAVGLRLAASRGTWVNLAVAGTILLVARPSVRATKVLLGSLLVAFLVVHALLLLRGSELPGRSELTDRFVPGSVPAFRSRLYQYDRDRFRAMARALPFVLRHPFGTGPGDATRVTGYGTHNLLLQVATENGVGALVALLVAIGAIIRACLTPWRRGVIGAAPSAAAIIAALVGLLVNGMFIDILYWRILWMLLGLGWAVGLLHSRARQVETSIPVGAPTPVRGG
jgi:hypothetical protein